jgi:hypothetical protein
MCDTFRESLSLGKLPFDPEAFIPEKERLGVFLQGHGSSLAIGNKCFGDFLRLTFQTSASRLGDTFPTFVVVVEKPHHTSFVLVILVAFE